MARMSIRATYALDEATNQRIKYLARTWHVSQAEVIRRSVRAAEEQSRETLKPADVVARYRDNPLPRNKEETSQAVRSLRELRHTDDTHRTTKPT